MRIQLRSVQILGVGATDPKLLFVVLELIPGSLILPSRVQIHGDSMWHSGCLRTS